MSCRSHQDDNISPQPYDSWDNDLLYAPTPGNFSVASSPHIHSSQPGTFLEYPSQQEPQSDELCFIPPTLWDKDKTYDEHPPIYLHYLIDWKVKLNNRTVTKVTEPDVVLAPGAYWQKVLREKVERVKSRKLFSDRRTRLEDTTVMASVLNDRSQKLHQQAEGIDIDWEMTEKQLLKWKELFRRGKKLKLDVCVNYVADDVPDVIREQLYAEDRLSRERKQRAKGNSSIESPYLPININVHPTPSPQPAIVATPADSPPSVLPSSSKIVDPVVVPDLPLDEAVMRYAEWHKTQVASQNMKDNVDLACQIALSNGYDLSQIDKDRNWNEYTDKGVMKGVAIRWTGQVREWLNHYEPLF